MSDRSRPSQALRASVDRFEVLRASRELFQRRLREIVKQSGVEDPAALSAFSREVGEAHDHLAAASKASESGESESDFTASRLTLMGDDELELDISVRGIGSRLLPAGGRNLWRSQLRYMTLLARPTMSAAGNPVGPEAICPGLWAISRHGIRLEQTLALLAKIEQGLVAELPGLYGEIDRLLASYGIDPAPGQSVPISSAAWSNPERAASQSPPRPPANALSSLQQAVERRMDVDQLASPLPFTAAGGTKSGNPALDAAALIMLNHLFDRLSALEAREVGNGNGIEAKSPLGALKARDLDLPLGKHEAVTLDTMAMIFEAIFDSAELPDAIKAAIGRLQIPLLKLSIADPSLFADDQHPARRLINRMARAVVGLPHNAGSQHPLCERIGRLAVAVRHTLEESGAALDPHLAELEALIAERDRAIQQATATHVQLVVQHEARLFATELAEHWLRVRVAKTDLPEIVAFLETYWLRVMVAAAADGGSQGGRWQRDSATGDDLIWSVQPKETGEERKRLASLASSLLRRIGSGLDEIGVPAGERTAFLNTLFDLQTRALRSHGQPAPPRSSADRRQPSGIPSPSSGACLLQRDGQQVRYLRMPAITGSSDRKPVAEWQAGDWLRFRVSDQPPMCGLCCWQSPSSATVLLFNPEWGYALAMPRAALDHQLRSGRAQIASRVALFDAAAERAIGLLERR
ncbi:MAG TPA: DUF1631 family protein [Accumulibacter sp.]|uniref:DUF1631 family protein n=1 Tax=Accumulibacter sp. TaxID=2053492 RepID=UPI0025EAA208|nr:DUF1631 family protein [Accumulibacter sp.]MCM8600570.1 DUF1631 domain-containing protein [Accumulibacter sp.]MCM8664352.1 DUF1631 domain-containing protein [Accumulibacter sp.]HNC51753.1 DUF1631 family protein [Accumulibacter sp.]